MSKQVGDYPDQVNVLTEAGTLDALRAIAYYEGQGGRYAGPARRFLADGIYRFLEALSVRDRKRYDEILVNVKIKSSLSD